MVTLFGNEGSIEKLVEDLLYLEHDAIAAHYSCGRKPTSLPGVATRSVQ